MEESCKDENTAGEETIDEIVEMKNNVQVGPFQTEILKGRVAQVPAKDIHIMVAPIRHAVVVWGKARSLPPDYKCCMHTPCSQLEVSKF